jgi:hypothetical protein
MVLEPSSLVFRAYFGFRDSDFGFSLTGRICPARSRTDATIRSISFT